MARLRILIVVLSLFLSLGKLMCAEPDPSRVLPSGQLPNDSRLGKPKDLNGYFPLRVPASLRAWETRRRELREQILVATGLWPMPEKSPLRPTIHGRIDRDDYSVEKVVFASYPGHYVSGNLYRPKGKTGKLAGVLCPHGHWHNGRFYEATVAEAHRQIARGAEKTLEGAKYPLQARCAHLARMGCVVFHYDMVGLADSQPIPHAAGFADAQAELHLQSAMGLQTFNSIRALDFLLSLPEVDPERIGVTGASGGGTQTFVLCAIDDRPAAAFPAVMVSTAMQGGCVCENCSYLRQDTGNIEIAGLFAPRPLGMTGARDWTIDIERKGLPELKSLYKLYGAEERVQAKCLPQFDHNYNQVSREIMYNWFNKHLRLGQPEPVVEKPFVPIPPAQLSVFDAEHPRPQDALGAEGLRKHLTESSDKQLERLKKDRPPDYLELSRIALRVMVNDRLPGSDDVETKHLSGDDGGEAHKDYRWSRLWLTRTGCKEQVPALLVTPAKGFHEVAIWIHPEGKSSLLHEGNLVPAAMKALERNVAILAPDLFLTGEYRSAKTPEVNSKYAGYTFGYNRPILADRVHDILSAVAAAKGMKGVEKVYLVGFENAGPWVLTALGLCGDAVAKAIVDLNGFRFASVQSSQDQMMLPGAVKYGDVGFLLALASTTVRLHNDAIDGLKRLSADEVIADLLR